LASRQYASDWAGRHLLLPRTGKCRPEPGRILQIERIYLIGLGIVFPFGGVVHLEVVSIPEYYPPAAVQFLSRLPPNRSQIGFSLLLRGSLNQFAQRQTRLGCVDYRLEAFDLFYYGIGFGRDLVSCFVHPFCLSGADYRLEPISPFFFRLLV